VSARDIRALESYCNAHRYFFTRLLLLAIEPEQIVDLVDAMMFQYKVAVSIDPSINQRPGGGFAVQQRVADLAASSVSENVRPLFQTLKKGAGKDALPLTGDEVAQVDALVARNVRAAVHETIGQPDQKSDDVIQAAKARVSRALVESSLVRSIGGEPRVATKVGQEVAAALDKILEQPQLVAQSIHLSELVDPNPVAISGNALIFRMRREVRQDVRENYLARTILNGVLDYPAEIAAFVEANSKEVTSQDVFLPTSGTFAEAVLGRANASEKVDPTRFYNWQDSPIPHQAAQIATLQAGGRAQEPLDASPIVPPNVLNVVAPAAFPAPAGLASSLGAVQNGSIFRDMSKAEALGSVLANLANLAQTMAGQASQLAGDSQTEALRSAADIGGRVSDLVAQVAAARATPPPPQSETSKAAALNAIEQFEPEPAPPPARPSSDGALRRNHDRRSVIGIPEPQPAPRTADGGLFNFLFLFVDPSGNPVEGIFDITIYKDGIADGGRQLMANVPLQRRGIVFEQGIYREVFEITTREGSLSIALTGGIAALGQSFANMFSGSGSFLMPQRGMEVPIYISMKMSEPERIRATSKTEALKAYTAKFGGSGGDDTAAGQVGGSGSKKKQKPKQLPGGALQKLFSIFDFAIELSGSYEKSETTTAEVEREYEVSVPTGGLIIALNQELSG
jgi:hypothetical protein